MKKFIYIIATILILLTVSCTDKNPAVPKNIKIEVEGRWMTVSWDPVKNASGYIVHTASKGCGSGNRIANTATQTATNHAEAPVTSKHPANGSVEFISPTQIRVWLMPARGSESPMAQELSAKVMALAEEGFTDSEYSEEVTITKEEYR